MAVVKGLLVLGVISLIQIVQHVSSETIDQIISKAANTSKQFDFLHEAENYVMLELDMMYKLKDWQEIQKLNANSLKSPRQKRKALRNLRARWTNAEIPYERISRGVFSDADIRQINNAINDWEMYTCITFRESATARNRVRFQDGGGCSSFVGMTGGVQPITLARGCRQKGTIVHEIGHAVGFHHEQTRPDRDNFVRILRENIPSNLYYNFQKYTQAVVNSFNVPYDYSSVMHYGSTAFSINGERTIQTLDPRFQRVIGNRQGHSFNDIKLANLMYDCAERRNCQNKTCPDDGFVGPDCNCWCRGSPVKRCDGGEIGEGGQTVATSEPITERPVTETCFNMNPNCEYWARIGECSRNPGYMTMYCQEACNVCDKAKSCEDMNPNCDYWQGQGYCSQMYVEYMRTNCPKSCGVCRSDEVPSDGSTDISSDGSSTTTAKVTLLTAVVAVTAAMLL